jgi:fatty acid desaturase
MSMSEVSAPQQAAGTLYAALLRQVRDAGLLQHLTGYYARRIAVAAALLIGGWTVFVLVGESWWQLAVAAFLAFMFTQLGFIGHEAGHRQIGVSRRASDIIGLVYGNLAVGLSYGWWVNKHNRHHANPNQEDKDPDIGTGALAFHRYGAANWRPAARLLYRYQAYLFFPLLLLEALNLHVASARALVQRSGRYRAWEVTLFVTHVVGYLGVVFLVLSPVKAVVFIAVQQGLFGLYLGCSFAPNHKGMPILGAEDNCDYLRRQVLTSRNVRGGWLIDYALGGLNHQIEHHLFPSMSRPNLRRARPLVREFCRQHGLPYAETGLFASYGLALRHLHEVGRGEPGTPAA